jgi:hypothetical protein
MWIETDLGWANLARLVRLERLASDTKSGVSRYRAVVGDDEESAGVFSLSDHRSLAKILAPVIPAAPGVCVYTCFFLEDLGELPEVEVYPVIGWRCHDELYREPLLPCDIDVDDSQYWVIALPDGRLHAPYDRTFDNRDAWIEHARESEGRRRQTTEKRNARPVDAESSP